MGHLGDPSGFPTRSAPTVPPLFFLSFNPPSILSTSVKRIPEISRPRRLCGVALLLVATLSGQAQETDDLALAAAEDELTPELAALLDDLRPGAWQTLAGVSAAWGQRSNPGLSTIAAESATFGQLGLEGFALRESERFDALALLDGYARWYDGHPAVDDEQAWFGRGEARWRPWAWVQASGSLQGYWQDQVLDITESIGARTVVPVKVAGGDLGGQLRLQLPWGFAVQGGAKARRADYQEVPEDHAAREWRGELIWSPAAWLEFAGAQVSAARDYDFRGEATTGGRILEDTRLGFDQTGTEARARVRFVAAGRWTLEGRWGTLENRDGTSGFYDYDRDRWSLDVEWAWRNWTVRGRTERSEVTYLVQTVGAGLTPDPRTQQDTVWEAELRRGLGERWEVFGQFQHDESLSNETDASYTDEMVWFGLNRLF